MLVSLASPSLTVPPPAASPLTAPPLSIQSGRFSVFAIPRDTRLARALLGTAMARDSYPGLPKPKAHVTLVVAPTQRDFRALTGPSVPEWGAAVAFPESQRIVVQGGAAPSSAGDPIPTLRHELAHLALHEYLDDLPPRWFDEGYATYAAAEGVHDEVLATNVALALRGVPTLASLDSSLVGTESQAAVSYALAYRAVADLAHLDPAHGLALLFSYWHQSRSLDVAVREAYGETLDGFEQQWRTRTRRRYGVLALVSDLSFGTLIFLVILMPLYLARRRRDQLRLQVLREAEVAAAVGAGEQSTVVMEPSATGGDSGPHSSGATTPTQQ